MSGKNFDVFISYRRSDGGAIARILNAEFALRDFRCFLDFDSLGGGKFDEKIEAAILDAPVFAMVLTPDYFSRCNDKGDWVRREIELALANNKIIIPINYDKNLNGIPDYLEEDFRERIGCHNFATVHKDDTFKSSFNQMVEERILKVVGKIVKQEHKAKVSVKSDADCELIEDDQVIATVQKDKTNFILLEKGEHEITARSSEFPQIREDVLKIIDDVSAKYLIKIKLADKVQPLREEKKRKEEEEKRKEEEAQRLKEEEAKKQQEEIQRQQEEEIKHKEEIITPTIVPQVQKLDSISPNNFRLLRTITGHSYYVYSVCWSTDGRYLASSAGNNSLFFSKGKLVRWDAKSGEKLQTLEEHSKTVYSVSWSPDGKYLASGSDDNTIIIWDAKSGEKLKTLKGHSGKVKSVCWSPDGKYLASGSWDCNVIIWDAKSGEKLKTLKGHSSFVNSVSWSPDGKYLASGSDDNTIIIWDANSGQRLKTLEGHSYDVYSVSWSPDGKYLASGSADKTVKIWGVE